MRGSWELALSRPEGLHHFDNSVDAFWRSFRVILYVIPIDLAQIMIITLFRQDPTEPAMIDLSDPYQTIGHVALIVAEWLTYPVLMVFLVRLLNVTARYAILIIASNWSALMVVALLVPFNLIRGLGIGSETASLITLLIIGFLVLRYRWFVTRTALDVSSFTAVGLVAIEFLISMIYAGISFRLIGAGV